MNRIFLCVLIFLAGCAQAPRMPVDVSLIPDDCANQRAITEWLTSVANSSRNHFQSQQDYENNVSAVKARIWRIR